MIAILHNIRSIYNVGSIFRTADAAGIEKIYLCGITPAPTDEMGRPRQQLAKVSLGAEISVPWEAHTSAVRLIDTLKKRGYRILALEQSRKSTSYYKLKTQSSQLKAAVVVGNEVKGLPLSILKRADKIIEIPMRGAVVRQARHPRRTHRGKESLNVSVAFGIVAFQMMHG